MTRGLTRQQLILVVNWSVSSEPAYIICVIVMTFWYVFQNGLNFFKLFFYYSSFGIDHDPHVLYVHMTYV